MSTDVPATNQTKTTAPSVAPHIVERCGTGLATACVVARLLVPTESAHLGDTLWIATLLLIAAIFYSVGRWQNGHRLRFDWFTAAVALMVIGHLVSGIGILLDVGNKRSALNMIWEWVGLGALCYVLRGRRQLLYVLLAMTLVHAGHGIWQYFVELPAQRAEFSALLDENANGFERAKQLRELQARGIPTNPSSLRLFADRLASLEPLGPFALANTLAGFLAIGTLLCTALLVRSNRTLMQYVLGVLCLVPLTYCLFLTKSRTAIVSVIAGLLLLGVMRLFSRGGADQSSKAGTAFGIVAVLLLVGAVIAGVATGGLDEQVISESPKSLRYRLMYWQGTFATLKESPWLGTGPGNFRQNYTVHKLAASSEEILDPHNLFLDAWCNGGVIALCGLLLLILIAARGLFRNASTVEDEDNKPPGNGGLIAGLLGFGLVLVYQFFSGQDGLVLTLSLAAGFLVAWFVVRFAFAKGSENAIGSAAAVATCGLVVHLLGAGGFSMPAVTQVLLLGSAATFAVKEKVGARHWAGLVPVMAWATIVFACLITATIPVTRSMYLVRAGDAALLPNDAMRNYGSADMIDPMSPLAASKLGRKQAELGMGALPALHRAKRRDPNDFKLSFALGMAIRRRWDASPPDFRQEEDIMAAIGRLEDAVKRYPTNPRLVAELSLALSEAGQFELAGTTAERALQLDEINRQNGHRDRYLDAEILSQLMATAERKIKKATVPHEKQPEK